MTKILFGVIVSVCLFTNTGIAQQPIPASREQSITLDIKVIHISARTIEEIEKLAQDKNRLNQMVAEGKAKLTANIQLKTLSGEPNNLRTGQRIPVPKTEGPNSQVSYENTGLNISVQPKITPDNLIEVKLTIEMTNVFTLDKNPIFMQKTLNNVVRLKPGETTLMLGFTQDEPLWIRQVEQGKSADEITRGNFFVLLSAKLTN
jgi:type II secretory pathway component GspD/PulD (secretin)